VVDQKSIEAANEEAVKVKEKSPYLKATPT